METKNIMIVGVGGQGTLLASKLLGAALLKMNYDVKVSEVHGMSQRGGSVVTYVRYGQKVHSHHNKLKKLDVRKNLNIIVLTERNQNSGCHLQPTQQGCN